MKKTLLTLILICTLIFVSAFQEVDPNLGETLLTEGDPSVEQDTFVEGDGTDGNSGDEYIPENQEDPIPDVPTEETTEEPIEAPVQTWQGIDESQAALLQNLYYAMTSTGQTYSGWFQDYNPCAWTGVTCENGVVTGLRFEGLSYFTTFPDAILAFSELKTLEMKNILMQGPLPENLFTALPKLEELILEGNLFTGEIPALPEAFAAWPALKTIHISDNLLDDDVKTMLTWAEYADAMMFTLDPQQYPDLDLQPGLDGELPADWNRLTSLADIDLSGNTLSGNIPDNWAELPLTELSMADCGSLTASDALYQSLAAKGLNLEGITYNQPAAPISEDNAPEEKAPETQPGIPPVEPTSTPEPVYVEPTSEPIYVEPTSEPIYVEPTATDEPIYVYPTDVPTAEPIYIVVTATPEPAKNPAKPQQPTVVYVVVTATPEPQRWYTATPYPVYSWNVPQPGQQQRPPQGQPGYQIQPVQQYTYPTATPYNSGYLVYPTATSSYSVPQFATATPVPTEDPGKQMGFTYVLEEMTENVIPMTWRYTGMTEYAIYFYDLNGSLYPAYAMNWTKAADLCTSSECNFSVETIPEDLLNGGGFSLQLNAKDSAGNVYRSDFVTMQVSAPEPTPTPTPEPEAERGFFSGFFHWLFGPILRLFGLD